MFSERLSEFIASIGETPTSFESKIGVSKGAIYKPVKNGKTIGLEMLGKIISGYPALNIEWLIAGLGTMWKIPLTEGADSTAEEQARLQMMTEDPAVEYSLLKGPKTAVSLVNENNAPNWNGTVDSRNGVIESVFFLPSSILPKGRSYAAFIAAGNGMEPTIAAGSLVMAELVKPRDYQRIQNGQVYVVITRERVSIRRITSRLKEMHVLHAFSDNREYAPYDIPEDEIVSLWKAKALFSYRFTNEPNHLYHLYQVLEDRVRQLEGKNNPG